MSEGLFGELDFDKASDNPFEIPENSYICYVTNVKVGPTKDKSKIGMTIEYTIDVGQEQGKKFTEWKHIPNPADPKNPSPDDLRALSFIKARMKDFGIPGERINSLKPEDLIGIRAVVSTKNKDGYVNVRKVTVVGEDFTGDPTSSDEVADAFTANL